jgi:hypothetical protein
MMNFDQPQKDRIHKARMALSEAADKDKKKGGLFGGFSRKK